MEGVEVKRDPRARNQAATVAARAEQLRAILRQRGPLGLAELARATGRAPARLRGQLALLVEKGFIARDGAGWRLP